MRFPNLDSFPASLCVFFSARYPFTAATQTLGASLKSTEEPDAQIVVFRRSCGRWISIPTFFAQLCHEHGGDGSDFSLSEPLNGYLVHAMLCDTRLSIVDVAEGTPITAVY